MIRRRTHFSGRVQGVGFRFRTREVAAGFDVSGYVMNLPDGRVELVLQGTAAEVTACHAAVTERMRANIREQRSESLDPDADLSGFVIRR